MKSPPLLASLVLLSSCAYIRPDHGDPKDLPPPVREEISWESLFWEPWRDPLHDKYEELFGRPFPNRGLQHFYTGRPFSDVKKYELAFEQAAVTGARADTVSAGGNHAVSVQLPESAGKPVSVEADEASIRLTIARPGGPHRYRVYPSDQVVLPLPAGADPGTARVTRDGDWVRITFLARAPRSGSSGRP